METGRLRFDALAMGAAAIAAVDPEAVVHRRFALVAGSIEVDGHSLIPPLGVTDGSRVVIVGGGKAAAAMAAGVVRAVAAQGLSASRLSGVISVPEGSGRSIPGIEVRETRPRAENLPTPRGVAASREMLRLVGSLGPDDIVIALISGGGSAVLVAPRPGVPLEEKVAVATYLTAAGADIREINAVRRGASDIKGGGLARACTAGRMLALVLSDVIGDPLEFIASGPCLPGVDAAAALGVLARYGAVAAGVAPRLVAALAADAGADCTAQPAVEVSTTGSWTTPAGCRVEHVLLGGNSTAVDAAAALARELGYGVIVRHAMPGPVETADEVGQRLAREGLTLAREATADGRPWAVIEGGEAVVRLPADHGLGGRNQQTVAASLLAACEQAGGWPPNLAIASLGTDGEDGPTTAAGGLVDAAVAALIACSDQDLATAVARCNTHPLLAAADGLIQTGPTGTNVADVRVVLARSEARP